MPPSAIPVCDGRTTGTEASPGLPRAASSLDHARLILERRTAGSNRGLEPVWVRPEGTSLTKNGQLRDSDGFGPADHLCRKVIQAQYVTVTEMGGYGGVI